ncbi:MAG: PASTA domain-containing protein [Actinobacteria bacterium]|nr:PASTA domain-containing protein [Actinomycetota bacterium]
MEDFEDEPDNRRAGVIWAVIVVVLLIVIGIAAYAIVRSGSSGTKTVLVPSLIGRTQDAANQALRDAGFVPGNITTFSGPCGDPPTADAPEADGKVCTQQFGANSKQPKGSTVSYTVYKQGTVQVPNLVGQSVDDAVKLLNDSKLQYARQDVPNAQPAGTVVAQDPPAYETVAPTQVVKIQVSNGKVAIPDVRGQSAADGKKALNDAGFANVTATSKSVTDQSQNGKIIDESPTPGSTFPLTQTITITVAQYVLPACPTTPAPPSSGSGSAPASASSSPPPSPSASPTCT